MSRRQNKKHDKQRAEQREKPVVISHSADRRCIAGCLPQGLARPKNQQTRTNYRPTAR